MTTGASGAGVSPPPSTSPRRRGVRPWVAVLLAGVIVAGSLGGYFVLRNGASPSGNGQTGGVPPVSGYPPSHTANVTGVRIHGDAVTATYAPGPTSLENESVGATFNVTVRILSMCDRFGCSAGVLSVSIGPPFLLVEVTPALPAYFSTPRIPIVATLVVQAPSVGGRFVLNGTVFGFAVPGPASVDAVTARTTYAGLDANYLSVQEPSVPLNLVGNTTFSLSWTLTSNSWYEEQIANVSVAPPFLLAPSEPFVVQNVSPNATFTLSVAFLAPGPGNYTLNLTIKMAPSPTITFRNVWANFIIHVYTFYAFEATFSPLPSALRPGQSFFFEVYFNSTGYNVSFVLDLNGVAPPWHLVYLSPGGNLTIPPNTLEVWTVELTAPMVPGHYDLEMLGNYWSNPPA